MFMKDKIISNLIVVDDYVSGIIKSGMDGYSKDGVMLAKDFLLFADAYIKRMAFDKFHYPTIQTDDNALP